MLSQWKIKIFTIDYYKPKLIKLNKMLYEPFMLNMAWKSTEKFESVSLKYGILKWKMCRNTLPLCLSEVSLSVFCLETWT